MGEFPHATRYAGIDGKSCARYGLLNVARTTRVPAFCSPFSRSAIPSGAESRDVEELAPKYDETITRSAPCAPRSAFSTSAGTSRGWGLARYAAFPVWPGAATAAVASKTWSVVRESDRSDGNTRASSALKATPAPRSVRGAIVTLTMRDARGKRPNGTTLSESFKLALPNYWPRDVITQAQLADVLGLALSQIVSGERTAEEAFTEAQQQSVSIQQEAGLLG